MADWLSTHIPATAMKLIVERYPTLLPAVMKLCDRSIRFLKFFQDCIDCCERARALRLLDQATGHKQKTIDRNVQMRREDAWFKKQQATLANTARVFARDLRAYPNERTWAALQPELSMRLAVGPYGPKPIELLDLLATLLACYEKHSGNERQIGRAKKIRSIIQAAPHPARLALLGNQLRLQKARQRASVNGNDGAVTSVGLNPTLSQIAFSDWLDQFADVMESRPFAQCGPFSHRFQLGPLMFANAIDRRARVPCDLGTGLLFGLVLLAREFTAPECESIQMPVMMPNAGRPLWPIALAGLVDTLGTDLDNPASPLNKLGERLDEKAVQNRLYQLLERHPDLGWVGWPELLPGDFASR